MYRVEKQTHKHRKFRRNITVMAVLLVVAGISYVLLNLTIAPHQEIHNAAPVSRSYDTGEGQKTTIEKPLFSLSLPQGWKEIPVDIHLVNAPKYMFAGSAGSLAHLDVYVDAIPTDLGINKAVVVTPQGDGLAHDSVSENCTAFTDAKLQNPVTGLASAKWQETTFLCDMANSNRQVVGTISSEGINQVTLTGTKGGTHKYFMTYTDNAIDPNYSDFYTILESFHVK